MKSQVLIRWINKPHTQLDFLLRSWGWMDLPHNLLRVQQEPGDQNTKAAMKLLGLIIGNCWMNQRHVSWPKQLRYRNMWYPTLSNYLICEWNSRLCMNGNNLIWHLFMSWPSFFNLLGGFKHVLMFLTLVGICWDDARWAAYLSDGLKPPTRWPVVFILSGFSEWWIVWSTRAQAPKFKQTRVDYDCLPTSICMNVCI